MPKPYVEPLSDTAAKLLRDAGIQPTRQAVRPAVHEVDPSPDPEPEPDPPIKPLGSLDRFLESQPDYVPPDAEPDAGAAVETAQQGLQRVMHRLARVTADPHAETGDVIAAAREIGRLAGVLDVGKAEARQRSVAEVDQDIATELRRLGWTVTPPG